MHRKDWHLVNRQKNNDLENPPKEVVDQLVRIYNQGQLSIVTEQAHNLTKKYPKSILIWNLLGAATSQIGMFDQSIKAFENIIIINPNFVDAHYNMGLLFKVRVSIMKQLCYKNTVSIKLIMLKPWKYGCHFTKSGKLEEAQKHIEKQSC